MTLDTKYKGTFGYFRSLMDTTSPNSIKSFTLFLSAIVGAAIGACICFAICYDVLTNGYIKTDLADAGIFLLCTGGYMAGAGIPKAMVDMKSKKTPRHHDYVIDEEENEE